MIQHFYTYYIGMTVEGWIYCSRKEWNLRRELKIVYGIVYEINPRSRYLLLNPRYLQMGLLSESLKNINSLFLLNNNPTNYNSYSALEKRTNFYLIEGWRFRASCKASVFRMQSLSKFSKWFALFNLIL